MKVTPFKKHYLQEKEITDTVKLGKIELKRPTSTGEALEAVLVYVSNLENKSKVKESDVAKKLIQLLGSDDSMFNDEIVTAGVKTAKEYNVKNKFSSVTEVKLSDYWKKKFPTKQGEKSKADIKDVKNGKGISLKYANAQGGSANEEELFRIFKAVIDNNSGIKKNVRAELQSTTKESAKMFDSLKNNPTLKKHFQQLVKVKKDFYPKAEAAKIRSKESAEKMDSANREVLASIKTDVEKVFDPIRTKLNTLLNDVFTDENTGRLVVDEMLSGRIKFEGDSVAQSILYIPKIKKGQFEGKPAFHTIDDAYVSKVLSKVGVRLTPRFDSKKLKVIIDNEKIEVAYGHTFDYRLRLDLFEMADVASSETLKRLDEGLLDVLSAGWDALKGFLGKLVEKLKEVFDNLLDYFSEKFADFAYTIPKEDAVAFIGEVDSAVFAIE